METIDIIQQLNALPSEILENRTLLDFNIAPNINGELLEKVFSLFNLKNDERVLLLRNIPTKMGEYFVVLTDRAIYHNYKKTFCLPLSYVTFVYHVSGGYCFYRGYRMILYCASNMLLFDPMYRGSIPGEKKLEPFLQSIIGKNDKESKEQKSWADSFLNVFSSLNEFTHPTKARIGRLDKDNPIGFEDHHYVSDIVTKWGIPDNETILLYREYGSVVNKFLVITDVAIYISKEISFRWDSIHHVQSEKEFLFFYDASDSFIKVPVHAIIKKRTNPFSKNNDEVYYLTTQVAEAFNHILQLQKVTNASKYFERSVEEHSACESLSIHDVLQRCPYCGSLKYHIDKEYVRKDREEKLKHYGKEIVVSGISYVLQGKPSPPSPYDSKRPCILDCDSCHKSWSSWRE